VSVQDPKGFQLREVDNKRCIAYCQYGGCYRI